MLVAACHHTEAAKPAPAHLEVPVLREDAGRAVEAGPAALREEHVTVDPTEARALVSLKRRGARIVLLAPSTSSPGHGVIPPDWKAFDGVLTRLAGNGTAFYSDLPPGIDLDWASRSIDGRIVVTITSEQILIRSGHDNPHKNHLYWVGQTSAEQASAVLRIVEAKRGTLECDEKKVNWPVELPPQPLASCRFQRAFVEMANGADHLPIVAKNARGLLEGLNRLLPKDVASLPVPDVQDLEQRVLISASADQLNDWIR